MGGGAGGWRGPSGSRTLQCPSSRRYHPLHAVVGGTQQQHLIVLLLPKTVGEREGTLPDIILSVCLLTVGATAVVSAPAIVVILAQG